MSYLQKRAKELGIDLPEPGKRQPGESYLAQRAREMGVSFTPPAPEQPFQSEYLRKRAMGYKETPNNFRATRDYYDNPQPEATQPAPKLPEGYSVPNMLNPYGTDLMQKLGVTATSESSVVDPRPDLRTDYPGGNLNPVNLFNQFKKYTAPGLFIDRAAQSVGRTIGLADSQMSSPASTGNKTADAIADFAGSTAGLFAPIGGVSASNLYNLPITQSAALAAGARNGSKLGSKLASEAVKEGMVGAPLAFQNAVLTGDGTASDIAKQTLGGAAAGAAGGAVFGAAGQGISAIRNNVTTKREVLDFINKSELPVNTNRRIVQEASGGVIKQGDTFAKNFNRIEFEQSPAGIAQKKAEAEGKLEMFRLAMDARYNPTNQNINVLSKLSPKERTTLNRLQKQVDSFTPPAQEAPVVAATPTIKAELPKRTETPVQPRIVSDKLKFSETVEMSPNTAQGLADELRANPMTGGRTTDVWNREQAARLIEKHGTEGLYSKLLAKGTNLSAAESTAAQILAKQFSSRGDKESMAKAISLISKTAREGREMGQAIQALSQWNKLDETGALLLGERQLNRGVRDTADWRSLTPEQATPIQEAAQRIGQAQQAKSLADEVMAIVTTKKPGEALTDAEKATINQFRQQVKEINEKAKPFLPQPKSKSNAQETISKVSKIKPKERTRDQVVNYLEAKAEIARRKLEKQRNVGLIADTNNPVILYSTIGAAKIAQKIVRYTDFAEAMMREVGDAVKPHLNAVYVRSVNMFRREHGLPTVEELDRIVNIAIKSNKLDKETAASLQAISRDIGYMADANLKLEATQDLQKVLKSLGRSTLGEKGDTILTGAHLLNFVTIGRNALGNAVFLVTEKINKIAAVPIDWTLSKLTGERTIQWIPYNQESLLRNFMLGGKSGWNGVSPTGTLSSYDIHPEVFGNRNPLKYITKALGATLQSFDFAAYRAAYGDVLATYAEQLGKSQGLSKAQIKQQMPDLIKKLDDKIFELADEAGLYATFQDETLLSQGAQMLKKGLNALTDVPSRKLVEKGLLPKSFSPEGFGLGSIVLKYARTPANLIMRGIDYSPIGFLRGIGELAPLVFNKQKFNQFAATRALARATTGTLGMTGLGYVLAQYGILTGASSIDKDERSIQEQSGQGAYKVNLSALSRFIASGLDKNAAKFQPGDRLIDYAWLQPMAISVAMGVNANKAVNDRKEGDDISGWQVFQKGLLGGMGSVLENPMVQGLSNVIDAGTEVVKYQKADKLKGILKGVPASFIPTLSNQARAATDNYQRETYDENLLTEIGNLMKNKVPGLSKTLPISYNSLGKPRERIQGGEANTVKQYLTSFFSPARLTEYQVSPEAKMVLDLMNESGDKGVLPRINDRYIMVDDPVTKKQKRVELTAEQFSRLQKRVGEEVESRLQKSANLLANPNAKVESKVDKVKDILSEVGQKVRNDFRAEMGYKKKQIR